MKKTIVLLIMCFMSTRSFAIVGGEDAPKGCYAKTKMSSCNNLNDNLECYWGNVPDAEYTSPYYQCYECSNSTDDQILVWPDTEVQPTVTRNINKMAYIRDGYIYDYTYASKGFCPTLFECPVGYGIKVYVSPNCSSLSGGCKRYFSCDKCGSGTYGKTNKLVRVYAGDNLTFFGLYTVKNTQSIYNEDTSEIETRDILEELPDNIASKLLGCASCGINATLNAEGTNCDCDAGYAYYNASGVAQTTSVYENNCEKRKYKIYLHTNGTKDRDNNKYITYQVDNGYDLDNDGVYGDDGSNLVTVNKAFAELAASKKNFQGWYFCEKDLSKITSGVTVVCDQAVWSSNTIDNINIVNRCKGSSYCEIDKYDAIDLYRWLEWKDFDINYRDTASNLITRRTCTYNSSCKLDYNPAERVPGGQMLKGWVLSCGAAAVVTAIANTDIKDYALANNFDHSLNATMSLTDCPEGNYCKDNVQAICPEGSYCPEGVEEPTLCPAGRYGNTTGLADSGCSGGIDAGYYGNAGATTSTGDGLIEAGYFATGGAKSKTPGINDCIGANTCGVISAGYFSTGGGTAANPAQNGVGCVGSGNTCGKISAGYFSTGGGTMRTPRKPTDGCLKAYECGLCAAGTYCEEGSWQEEPCDCGYYCPAGSSAQKECGEGNYCESGSGAPEKCTAGYYCSGTTTCLPTGCDIGSYCPEGSTAETPCPVGFFCEDPSKKQECKKTSYCPEGSTSESGCHAGYYCDGNIQTQCEAGYYCPKEITKDERGVCPTAMTSDVRSDEQTDCYINNTTVFYEKSTSTSFNLPVNKIYFVK